VPDSQADLISIGAFAQAARMTIRALRHYDDLGVLSHAWVDPLTHYRYYRWSQLNDAVCVAVLREPGRAARAHPGSSGGGSPLHEVLRDERTRLERQAVRVARSLAVVEALQPRAELPPVAVDVVGWDDTVTLTATGSAHADTLHADAAELVGDLLAGARALGVDTTDNPAYLAYAFLALGITLRQEGDHGAAIYPIARCLEWVDRYPIPLWQAHVFLQSGMTAAGAGAPGAARSALRRSVQAFLELGDQDAAANAAAVLQALDSS